MKMLLSHYIANNEVRTPVLLEAILPFSRASSW
jgi:hypothetical protein